MKLFITGIGTDVGKTIAAAIITEALEADYWKPVQAGDLHSSDSHKVRRYLTNTRTRIWPNSYALHTPASPHAASARDGIVIDTEKIIPPETGNHLVIEGAGGLLVPLSNTHTIADIIRPGYKVIIVSRHYLGSINHTLLTAEALRHRGLHAAGIVFSGDELPPTESIILQKTGLPMIGRIEEEPYFDKAVIRYYADLFHPNLIAL